ncbi:MAG: hypothetical protein HQL75_11155 [Magnetococcales bacterium]|nr:hypothetical protein [Magnetococcales bacterium]
MEGTTSKLLVNLGPGEVLKLTGPGVVQVSAVSSVSIAKTTALGSCGVLGKVTAKFALPAMSTHFPAVAMGPVFGVGVLVLGTLWLVKTWTTEEKKVPVSAGYVE